MNELTVVFSTGKNPRLKRQVKAVNKGPQDKMYSRGNSERFEQRNALTMGLIEITKQMKRVAFLIGSLQC